MFALVMWAMAAVTDLREQNDPSRDASRPYGEASADENALRSLASIGGGSQLTLPSTRGGTGGPAPLTSLLTDDAVPTTTVGNGTGEVDPGSPGPVARGNAARGQGDDGGLGQQYDFMASNELINKALAVFPPAVQSAFENRKIGRPTNLPENVYGRPATTGGYYSPANGDIVLARANASVSGNADIDVGGAQHELLHAIASEGQGFAQDQKAGFADLRQAFGQDMQTLLANPVTAPKAQEALDRLKQNDPDHAFTALGDLYLTGTPLPPELASYFDRMKDYRPANVASEAAPAVERGATVSPEPPSPEAPFNPRAAPSAYRGGTPIDVLGAANRFLRSGSAQVEQGWTDIVNNFGPAIDALLSPHASRGDMLRGRDTAAIERSQAALAPLGGALRIVGSPFTAAAETIRTGMVQSTPELRGTYEQSLAAALKTESATSGPNADPAAMERQRASAEAKAAQEAIDAGRTKLWNAAGDASLPQGTRIAALGMAALLGAETVAELAVPSMLYRVPSVFRSIARSNLFTALARADALPAQDATTLRLAALNDADTSLVHERDAALAQIEGGLTGRIGANPESVVRPADANAGPLGAQKVATEAMAKTTAEASETASVAAWLDPAIAAPIRQNLGDIMAERMRLSALRSQVTAEAPSVFGPEEERAILAGIQATAEQIAPQLEARTQNLGDLMRKAADNAQRQMFAALRRAMTEGETFKMRNLTVGEDAEGKAVRLRTMVGTFDRAMESIQNVAAQAGHETTAETLLAPFRAARAQAIDALQAAEAYNAAIKRSASLAGRDYRAAALEARKTTRDVGAAETKVVKAGERGVKAEARVGAAEGAQADTRTAAAQNVDTLQTRVDAAKAAAADAAQDVKYRIGGDKTPETANAAKGYVSPDVSEVWKRNRLHTGTFDDPLVGEAMSDWVKANPGAIDQGEHHWNEFTSAIASLTGADILKVQRSIPKTGDLTRTFYVAEQVFSQIVKEWQTMGKAVADGYGTEAQLADKTAQVLAFEEALRRGIGELGRGLAARNLVKKVDAVQVLAAGEKVRLSYTAVERAAKKVDLYEGKLTDAIAASSKTAGVESDAVIKARGALEAAVTEFEAAQGALDDARKASSVAADAAYRAALRKAVAEGATKQAVQVLAKFDPEDVVGIAAFLRSLKPQGAGALLMRAAVAGRYGKIPANIQNFLGNNAYALLQEGLVRPATMLTAPIASRIAGTDVRVTPKVVGSAWLGLSSNIPDAVRFLAETLWRGSSPTLALKHGIADYETLVGQGLEGGNNVYRVLGRTFEVSGPGFIPLDISLRGLYGSDGFQRILYNGADRRALLAEKAMSAGKGIDGAVTAVGEDLSVYEREWLRQEALTKTFNEPIISSSEKGNSVERLERSFMGFLGSVDFGGFQPLRLIIPAARYGMRQTEVGLRISGAGLLTGANLARRARNTELTLEERTALTRQGTREMAEGAIGAGLLSYGFYLASTGNLTGAMPTKVSERNRWQTLGIQPMSLKVGDHYVPLGWFGPLGVPFALAALVHDNAADADDATLADRISRSATGIGALVTDQPAFYATAHLIGAINTGIQQQNWEQMASIVSQLATVTSLGGMAQTMTAVFDPYERNPEGLIQRVFARYPGLSNLVPPRIDQRTGQPILKRVTGPEAIIQTDLGTARSMDDLSPVERATLDVNIGNLSQTLSSGAASVKLSQEQYASYQQDARTRGEADAAKVMATDLYKKIQDPAVRQAMLRNAYDKGAAAARVNLADTLLSKAKTTDEVTNAAVIARTAYPTYRYVLAVASLMADGRLTSDVAKKLDDSRGRHADGTSDPTVAEIRASAPLVRQYVGIRPFLRGDQQEWQQLAQERTEHAAIKNSQGDKAAADYARVHPLLAIYANGAMTNPARNEFVTTHPAVKVLVAGAENDWQQSGVSSGGVLAPVRR